MMNPVANLPSGRTAESGAVSVIAVCVDELDRNGFVVVPNVIDERTTDRLIDLMARIGTEHGRRNVLREFDEVRWLAHDQRVRSLVERALGTNAIAVRGLFFDKTPYANWMVDWHQDRTIAVRERRDVPGFKLWTLKANVVHVQPPDGVLEQMLTVRLHLDDSDEMNGPLRVISGSHRAGIIPEDEIGKWIQLHASTTCIVPRGGALLMRPLLLHASSRATHPVHRRVLHLEYAAQTLPGGLVWAFGK
jgi:ectoine hydroxylase-related dioxygenase (phytanoyl-CoA dioxygenase family)